MKEFNKITVGFVNQKFENIDGAFVCVEQEFIAGDQCDYENKEGNPIERPNHYEYQTYDMTTSKILHKVQFNCPSACPRCGAKDEVDWQSSEHDGETLRQSGDCGRCDSMFTEISEIKYIYTEIDAPV